MKCKGTVGEERGDGGKRGFSLTLTRVGSHHSSRMGFPSKYKWEREGKVAKKGSKGEHVQTPACIHVNKTDALLVCMVIKNCV
jgi:hypothetical protein